MRRRRRQRPRCSLFDMAINPMTRCVACLPTCPDARTAREHQCMPLQLTHAHMNAGGPQAMATALQTIGKFIIRKKVGEQDQIFGRCGCMALSAEPCPAGALGRNKAVP